VCRNLEVLRQGAKSKGKWIEIHQYTWKILLSNPSPPEAVSRTLRVLSLMREA
jgi:hypothetical protein